MNVLKNKTLPFIFLAISALTCGCGQNPSEQAWSSDIFRITGWKTTPGDSAGRANMDFDDSSWTRLDDTRTIKITDPAGWFWLRLEFTLPDAFPAGEALLSMRRLAYPAQVFLNEILITEWGGLPPYYSARQGTPFIVELPQNVLKRNSPNTLALRCNYLGPKTLTPISEIRNSSRFSTWHFFSDLLNADLFYALSAIFLFMTLFLFLLAAMEKNGFAYLLLALSCATMALYYSEIGAPRTIVSGWYMRVVIKTCLNISLGFLIHFLGIYFGRRIKPAMVVWTYILVFFSTALIMASGNETQLGKAINASLIITFALAIYCLLLIATLVGREKREGWVMLAGAILAITMGGYDAYCVITKTYAFALLQGIGLFMLYLGIFIAISVRMVVALKTKDPTDQKP